MTGDDLGLYAHFAWMRLAVGLLRGGATPTEASKIMLVVLEKWQVTRPDILAAVRDMGDYTGPTPDLIGALTTSADEAEAMMFAEAKRLDDERGLNYG